VLTRREEVRLLPFRCRLQPPEEGRPQLPRARQGGSQGRSDSGQEELQDLELRKFEQIEGRPAGRPSVVQPPSFGAAAHALGDPLGSLGWALD